MENILNKLIKKENLTQEEMEFAMNEIMDGNVSDIVLSSFLTALKIKGETIEEITGGATVMRARASHLNCNSDYGVDIVGTGGDGHHTFNISTASSFILAAAGVTVVKHGNRSVSSQCGSADVLEALGVNISMTPIHVQECVNQIGFGFLFAPNFHLAMRHATKVRKELGFRTIFNMLGPLTNPAQAKGFCLGVFDENLTEVYAKVLKNLGAERALVVHGMDGMDEITVSDRTKVTELNNGEIKTYYIEPSDFGMKLSSLDEIKGGDAKVNSDILRGLLKGEIKGAKLDILLLNSGASLYVGKKANSLEEGVKLARTLIESGLAYEKLKEIVAYSKEMVA